jgi:hypothetical protein
MDDIQVTVVSGDSVDGTHLLTMQARDVRLIQSGLERGILQAEARNNKTAVDALRDLLSRLRRGIETRTRTDGTRVAS